MGGAVYATDAPALRIVAPLDTLVVLFHRPSGMTHLLASPAPELLDALAEGPADAGTLLARLARDYEVADADPAAIAARMEELAATGLAWRV